MGRLLLGSQDWRWEERNLLRIYCTLYPVVSCTLIKIAYFPLNKSRILQQTQHTQGVNKSQITTAINAQFETVEKAALCSATADTQTCINEFCPFDRSATRASGREGHGTSSEPWWFHLLGAWWASAPLDEPPHSNTGTPGATGREWAGTLHGLCATHKIKLGANNNKS